MDHLARRMQMVETQIVARGVRDPRVLEAMRAVPRHLFVPAGLEDHAYSDRPLAVGEGQTISQPYMVALMTETLAPEAGHRVLEIGTGSGYQAAILARLAGRVISIERRAALAERARKVLEDGGFGNVEVVLGDGTEGHAPAAPYDRILVTAGAPSVPPALQEQLTDGGRLVIPVGPADVQHLAIIERSGNSFAQRLGPSCVFVPLVGRHGWPSS
jgi:protein-L-isoaspartate(D-aspartate) O-methyltransferase